MYKVGLVYNEPKKQTGKEKILDPRSYRQPAIIADYVEQAFISRGHRVIKIPATLNLLQDIQAAGKLDVILISVPESTANKNRRIYSLFWN